MSSSVFVSASSSTKRSARATDIFVKPWIESSPIVTASTSGLSRAPLHSGHGREAHVLLDPVALLRGVGLLVAPLKVVHEPLEGHRVLALAAHPVAVGHEDLLAARSLEEPSCCSLVSSRHGTSSGISYRSAIASITES